MSLLNTCLRNFFTLLFFPVKGFSPWIAMILISGLTGLLLLAVYRLVSDQAGIRKTKDRIKAHLLELRLFQDDFLTSLRAQGNLLLWNLRYMLHALRPLLVMLIPLILILSHLNLWFASEPLSPGMTTLLKIHLKRGHNPLAIEATVNSGEGISLESPAVRIEEEGEISWRIRALRPGRHEIILNLDGQEIRKEVVVGSSLVRLSALRPSPGIIQELLFPGEKPLPASLPISDVSIIYPPRRMNFLGWKIHWLIAYFVLSIVAGFILKRPLKVEI